MSNSTDLVQGFRIGLGDCSRVNLRTGNPILAAALEYHQRGWSIIPIAAGTKKPPKGSSTSRNCRPSGSYTIGSPIATILVWR